ncbi:MAG: hypothetical protein ACUVQ0_01870 [Thermoproteota archaeon]
MNRLFAAILILLLTVPLVATVPIDESEVSLEESTIYIIELNPLTQTSKVEYKSTVTVKNPRASSIEYRFIQRLFHVDPSTLDLPNEASILRVYGEICMIQWVVETGPGTSILEVRGKPKWLPLEINASLRINGLRPNYTSAYGTFFASAWEGDVVEWILRLRNNYTSLLDSLTNISAKPPLFVSISMSMPRKYFRNIVFNPPVNTTNPLDKDSVSWVLILKDEAEIRVNATVDSFDDWNTVPLPPISISFSPMEDSVKESVRSQIAYLNMSIGMMEAMLLPLGNMTGFMDMFNTMLNNLSNSLSSMGNQTLLISDSLKTMSNGLSYAVSGLSKAASILLQVAKDVSKIDFAMLAEQLNASRQIATKALNQTLKILSGLKGDLLRVNDTLTSLRNNLTDPDQIALVDDAVSTVTRIYNNVDTLENQLKSAGSQVDAVFESLKSFLNVLKEYGSSIVKMSSSVNQGLSALSGVSSALSEISEALRLMGNAGIMMGENMSSIAPVLENTTTMLKSIRNSLCENITGLRKSYNELSAFLRLMDYRGNMTALFAPEPMEHNQTVFRPFEEGDDLVLSGLFFNGSKIGVRSIRVIYSGAFKGVFVNNSIEYSDPAQLGLSVSNDSITLWQFRFHEDGNILKIWNGQDAKLVFSNGSKIIGIDVDYSAAENLFVRSESLEYTVLQPTLGKSFKIPGRPVETPHALKTGLDITVILLSVTSLIAIIVLIYVLHRREVIII